MSRHLSCLVLVLSSAAFAQAENASVVFVQKLLEEHRVALIAADNVAMARIDSAFEVYVANEIAKIPLEATEVPKSEPRDGGPKVPLTDAQKRAISRGIQRKNLLLVQEQLPALRDRFDSASLARKRGLYAELLYEARKN